MQLDRQASKPFTQFNYIGAFKAITTKNANENQRSSRCQIPGNMATFDDFLKVDIRAGRIISAEELPETRNPSYKLLIDLGEVIGIKKSIAQLTINYKPEDLQGKLVLCVVNFAPRQIGKSVSEVLTLGLPDRNNQCVIVVPDKDVPVGGRLY